MYDADFNAPGLDPTLARERSFFKTFAMAKPPEYGVEQGNVLSREKLLRCTKANRRGGALLLVALKEAEKQRAEADVFRCALDQHPLWVAYSTDRRNTLGELLCW